MGLFKWLGFGTNDASPPTAPPAMPWDAKPSLYDFVRDHLRADGGGLTDGGTTLPDEERYSAGETLRWAPGARDGVMSHHAGGQGDDPGPTDKILAAVRDYCVSPTAQNKLAAYQILRDGEPLSLIDPVLSRIRRTDGITPNRLYDLAHSLATESPDRNPVKFGLGFLGIYAAEHHREVLMTLGRHDEFTLYAAVALRNNPDAAAAEGDLWELARSVHGWGRVHTVERLADTQDARIKDWMLRDGFRNSILNEYLAYTCATTGGLLAALSADDVDDDLLLGGGEILAALINGGPAQSIADYDDAPAAVEHYLRHVARRPSALSQLLTVERIRTFLEGFPADDESESSSRWTPQTRAALLATCREIAGRPLWTDLVRRDQVATDEQTFHNAREAAKTLKIDLWPRLIDRLRAAPDQAGRWYDAAEVADVSRIDDVIRLARESLPLGQIATGPRIESGMGPAFGPHSCLDYLLQRLKDFPGHGGDLLLIGLRSPVIRNRHLSLNALAAWPRATWPAGTREALEAARAAEPEDKVRAHIAEVMQA